MLLLNVWQYLEDLWLDRDLQTITIGVGTSITSVLWIKFHYENRKEVTVEGEPDLVEPYGAHLTNRSRFITQKGIVSALKNHLSFLYDFYTGSSKVMRRVPRVTSCGTWLNYLCDNIGKRGNSEG